MYLHIHLSLLFALVITFGVLGDSHVSSSKKKKVEKFTFCNLKENVSSIFVLILMILASAVEVKYISIYL